MPFHVLKIKQIKFEYIEAKMSIREFLVEEVISVETEEEKNEEVFSINEKLVFLFQTEDLAIPLQKRLLIVRIMQRKAWIFLPF